MTTLAHVKPTTFGRGIEVFVEERGSNGSALLAKPQNRGEFDSWVPLDPAATPDAPSYYFSEGVARALLEALLNHYRGGHDARQLCGDYEAERARVDKLIDAVIGRA